MVAMQNLLPGGTSKRNPNPNLERAAEIRYHKSRRGRRERAEDVQSNGPVNAPRDRAERIHWETNGPLRERVKAGVISGKDAIAELRKKDNNPSEAFIRWAKNR